MSRPSETRKLKLDIAGIIIILASVAVGVGFFWFDYPILQRGG